MKITRKCKHCKKWFAMKMQKKTVVRKDEIKILERLYKPGPKGELQPAHDHFAPGERLYYDVRYICKYCGAEEKEYVCENVKK